MQNKFGIKLERIQTAPPALFGQLRHNLRRTSLTINIAITRWALR